jgi:hypothetical protein
MAGKKNGGREGKCDLKHCSRWPKTEYVRTSIGAFDRTRAVHGCVCA